MAEMNYKNLTTAGNDAKVLSVEDEKIRDLLGNLKRVEAPNNFDFRVKARIASASPAGYRTAFLPVLRYVLPLGAILVVLTGFVLNGLYFADEQSLSTVAENAFQSPISETQTIKPGLIESNTAEISLPPIENSIASGVSGAAIVRVKNKNAATSEIAEPLASEKSAGKPKTKFAAKEENIFDNTGGTRFSALTEPKQIITPPGINLNNVNKTTTDLPDFVKTKPLTAKEVLSQLGIDASYTNESWKVLSVRQNSPAESSDVRTGDVVEAIDGEKLTDKPMRSKTIEGKNLTLRRGAQKIEISPGIKSN